MNNKNIVNVNLIDCNSVVITGGTSSEFLKADGTRDGTTYFIKQVVAPSKPRLKIKPQQPYPRCSQDPSARYQLQETLSHGLHLGHTQQTQYQSLLIKPQGLDSH